MQRIALGAAAVLSATLLLSMPPQRSGWIMALVVWGVAALAAARPFDGLLVLAGVGPVVTIFSILVGANTTGLHYPEALTLAFLAGAGARRAFTREPLTVPPRIAWPAVLLIAAAVASAVVQSAVLGAEQREPVSAGTFAAELVRDYLVLQNTATVAILFAEGMLLLLLAIDLCARTPARRERVLVMVVAGAAGAAALNLVRLLIAAMRYDNAGAELVRLLGSARVSVQYPDWNAAGSHLVMALLIAIGFLFRRRSYAVPVLLLGAGLWLTGSRVALAAVPVTFAASALLAMRGLDRRRIAAVAGVIGLALAVIAAGWMFYPSQRNDPAMFSASTRLVLWKAGVRMMATDPVFGVGLGRFYVLSPDYAGEMLQTIWRPHENAHNYFVQVLAELGVPGLLLFVAVIGFSLFAVIRRDAAMSGPAWGLAAGLFAFLLTLLTGHSLVVPDAAYPFWITLGVAGAMAVPPNGTQITTRSWVGWIGAVVLAALAMSVPFRMPAAVRNANRENTVVGLSAWQREADGTRYRWAEAASTMFVRSSGRAIRIPLRRGPDAPAQVQVRIFFDGKEAERIQLQGEGEWRNVRLVRPRQGSDGAFFRIDLEVTDAGGVNRIENAGPRTLMVGQPSIVWDR